jgi:quinol monooxygenase YgiN
MFVAAEKRADPARRSFGQRKGNAMIVIEAILEASPGRRDDLITLMRRIMAASQQEKGCVLYRFAADLDRPEQFVLTELWDSEGDLKAHLAGRAVKDFFVEFPGKGRFVGSKAWQGPLGPYVLPSRE